MKLDRREFLRVTGLTALLAAFGIELPEVMKQVSPIPHGVSSIHHGASGSVALRGSENLLGPSVVIPPTGRIEIQYSKEGGDWTFLDERDEARVLGAFRKPAAHSPGLRIRKFQHTLAVSDELALDADFLALPEFRDWLTAHYAVCYAKVTEAEILTEST